MNLLFFRSASAGAEFQRFSLKQEGPSTRQYQTPSVPGTAEGVSQRHRRAEVAGPPVPVPWMDRSRFPAVSTELQRIPHRFSPARNMSVRNGPCEMHFSYPAVPPPAPVPKLQLCCPRSAIPPHPIPPHPGGLPWAPPALPPALPLQLLPPRRHKPRCTGPWQPPCAVSSSGQPRRALRSCWGNALQLSRRDLIQHPGRLTTQSMRRPSLPFLGAPLPGGILHFMF